LKQENCKTEERKDSRKLSQKTQLITEGLNQLPVLPKPKLEKEPQG
jgi:hypothetical protein